jgi:hypothetical protein
LSCLAVCSDATSSVCGELIIETVGTVQYIFNIDITMHVSHARLEATVKIEGRNLIMKDAIESKTA